MNRTVKTVKTVQAQAPTAIPPHLLILGENLNNVQSEDGKTWKYIYPPNVPEDVKTIADTRRSIQAANYVLQIKNPSKDTKKATCVFCNNEYNVYRIENRKDKNGTRTSTSFVTDNIIGHLRCSCIEAGGSLIHQIIAGTQRDAVITTNTVVEDDQSGVELEEIFGADDNQSGSDVQLKLKRQNGLAKLGLSPRNTCFCKKNVYGLEKIDKRCTVGSTSHLRHECMIYWKQVENLRKLTADDGKFLQDVKVGDFQSEATNDGKHRVYVHKILHSQHLDLSYVGKTNNFPARKGTSVCTQTFLPEYEEMTAILECEHEATALKLENVGINLCRFVYNLKNDQYQSWITCLLNLEEFNDYAFTFISALKALQDFRKRSQTHLADDYETSLHPPESKRNNRLSLIDSSTHQQQPVSEPTQPLHEVSPASERGSLRPVIQQLMKDVSQLVCQLSEIEKRLSSA